MAKRFTDTNKWDKLWYRKLPPEYKCLWDYLFTKCDVAGIYDVDIGLASFIIGVEFQYDIIIKTFKDQIQVINENKWWLIKFVDFQYGELSENCKPHQAVIKRLKKYNLKGYTKGIEISNTLKDKDKDKVKDKDIEQRAEAFINKACAEALKIQPSPHPETLDGFTKYWTEFNDGGNKMRFEMQKVFNIKRRLQNWIKNDKEWNITKTLPTEYKMDTTGKSVVGYCEKCLKSDFYNPKSVLTDDSRCCKGRILPNRESH